MACLFLRDQALIGLSTGLPVPDSGAATHAMGVVDASDASPSTSRRPGLGQRSEHGI